MFRKIVLSISGILLILNTAAYVAIFWVSQRTSSSIEQGHHYSLFNLKELIAEEKNPTYAAALEAIYKMQGSLYDTFTSLRETLFDALVYNALGWLLVFTYLLIYKNPAPASKPSTGGEEA